MAGEVSEYCEGCAVNDIPEPEEFFYVEFSYKNSGVWLTSAQVSKLETARDCANMISNPDRDARILKAITTYEVTE